MLRVRGCLSKIFLSIVEISTIFLFLLGPVFGQTTIDLQTQSRDPDFSSMPFTRPITVGTSLPATCQVGQLFFSSSAAPGGNIFGCTATNIWSAIGNGNNLTLPLSVANGGTGTSTPSLIAGANVSISGTWPNQTISATGGGGGGASLATQLLDFAPSLSGRTASFGNNCSATTACLVFLNGARYVFTNASSITVSGSSNDTLYYYVDTTGTRTVGYSSTDSYTPTNVTVVSGITAFPQSVYPLYQCTVTAGVVTACSDYRPILSQTSFANGLGTAVSNSGGVTAINITETVDYISLGTYTIPGTACGHFEVGTNASSATFILPQPGAGGQMTNGCAIAFKASAAGSIALTPGGGATINGTTSYTVASGHACRVVSDGTNYQTEVCP